MRENSQLKENQKNRIQARRSCATIANLLLTEFGSGH